MVYDILFRTISLIYKLQLQAGLFKCLLIGRMELLCDVTCLGPSATGPFRAGAYINVAERHAVRPSSSEIRRLQPIRETSSLQIVEGNPVE